MCRLTSDMSFLFVLFTLRICGALLCYKCSSYFENSSCVSQPRSLPWVNCDGQCQVWRLYSEADSSIYMFERSCSSYCRSGCTQLADMEHRFIGCSDCCDTNFCNTENTSGLKLYDITFSTLFFYQLLT